ncbi:hypothetical protein LCGC14_2505120 [marine sediment metagenome]|uniref:Uncharacterized protein n=1 Tax=marine sediment metagenome TaxID=412755 RepID=A0A0F9B1F3_9ZZZZ
MTSIVLTEMPDGKIWIKVKENGRLKTEAWADGWSGALEIVHQVVGLRRGTAPAT